MSNKYCSCDKPALAGMLKQGYQKQCSFCGGIIPEFSNEDQHVMLKIKSLLNHLDYIIKEDHKQVVNDYHKLCRKFCNWGEK